MRYLYHFFGIYSRLFHSKNLSLPDACSFESYFPAVEVLQA